MDVLHETKAFFSFPASRSNACARAAERIGCKALSIEVDPYVNDYCTVCAPLVDMLILLSSSRERKKRICEVCTIDAAQPFLVEEGSQESAHRQSRAHRKRLQKRMTAIVVDKRGSNPPGEALSF